MLEECGVGCPRLLGGQELDGQRVHLRYDLICRYLLKDTTWATKDLKQLLGRIPGALASVQGRLAGHQMRVIEVSRQALGLDAWGELLPAPLEDDAEQPAILSLPPARNAAQIMAEMVAIKRGLGT